MQEQAKNTIRILKAQRDEITEHYIYKRLAGLTKDPHNKKILKRIAYDEMGHYRFWRKLTNRRVRPNKIKAVFFILIAYVFGLTFAIKLMEKLENSAITLYADLKKSSPGLAKVIKDEERHEQELINLIDEEKLKYVSSMVLGLNDALVELTGALAGMTLALQNTRLVAIAGLITGTAASMSMAASEYLSTKEEETDKSPLKASIYTGIAYVITVLFLIFPYLLFSNIFLCLGFVVTNALLVVVVFTFYISVAKELNFKKRFLEMAGISIGIAVINFFVGFLIRKVFLVEV